MCADHLIILPCHSIWKGGNTNGLAQDEWHLAPFQYEGQDHLCFREHLVESIKHLQAIPTSVLVVSGGKTKREAGPISEAQSYYNLLTTLEEWHESLRTRVYLEEYARDSFENVLFLLCRFYEITNRYPSHVSVTGFEFKRDRFVNHHLGDAMKFPIDRVFYYGNAPRPDDTVDQVKYFEELERAEEAHALAHFRKDPYGTSHPLSTKKDLRNPFDTKHTYADSNPQLLWLLKQIYETEGARNSRDIQGKFNLDW